MSNELKTLLVVVFIFMMIAVMFQAVAFMMEGQPLKQVMLEQFTSQPNRASDCRCLPGYVPSNTPAKVKYGGRIIHLNGAIYYIPNGSNTKYWVSSCTQCDVGINFCDPKVYVNVTQKEGAVYENGPTLSCSVLKEAQSKKILPTYFCQSLSTPSDTKQCY
jgi:hypothetical protein